MYIPPGPDFLNLPIIDRSFIVAAASPPELEGLQTLTVMLRRQADYDFVVRLCRPHGWVPRCRHTWDGVGGTVNFMRREDLKAWASRRFYPLED
jgi:hypothetical protein